MWLSAHFNSIPKAASFFIRLKGVLPRDALVDIDWNHPFTVSQAKSLASSLRTELQSKRRVLQTILNPRMNDSRDGESSKEDQEIELVQGIQQQLKATDEAECDCDAAALCCSLWFETSSDSPALK